MSQIGPASTKTEADNHLRDIRSRKGVDDAGGQHSDNLRDLNRALDLLSDQLYTKETHFILELIQNADDNTFQDETPSLTFCTKLPGNAPQMRIDCNEAGFTKGNVEALCRIGDSTKKRIDRTKGFIGEKGIGFKSVFKVADVVHISSKAYSFKFDRSEPLGMITPILESFPLAHFIDGQTQILLNLRDRSNLTRINKDLQEIHPELLIFLRKLRKMTIYTPSIHVKYDAHRTQDNAYLGGETITLKTTHMPRIEKPTREYIIVRETFPISAKEDRREGVTETEIVLAFPVNADNQPLLEAQLTYAYLPIEDYGFHYLIQADFLLTANRENVDESEWNLRLQIYIMRAFEKAVSRFNRITAPGDSKGLRYAWPLFLRDRGGTSPFWFKLKLWILHSLKKSKVLESRADSKLCFPKDLLYIPNEFRLNGEPLVEDKHHREAHLSFSYDTDHENMLPELIGMGVAVMKFAIFHKELTQVIKGGGNSFLERQSNKWHATVADLICSNSTRGNSAHLPLIPLRDGRWVTNSEKNLYLNRNTNGPVIPRGIDICLVDADACKDIKRKRLFRWLGIGDCSPGDVCLMIMELHARPPTTRTIEDWVSDAIYLFRMPRDHYKSSIEGLCLVKAGDSDAGIELGRGNQLYVDTPGTPSLISMCAPYPISSGVRLIHPMYLQEARKLGLESNFTTWVQSSLKVSSLPRLTTERKTLTREFEFLKIHHIADLLLLLRDHWNHYSRDLDPHSHFSRPLLDAMSKLKVSCTDGVTRSLDETVLPIEVLKTAGKHLPFLDIPDPNNPGWLNFSAFGVLTGLSIKLYMCELKALARLPITPYVTKSVVQEIYTQLTVCSTRESSLIRADFAKLPLVFLLHHRKWVHLDMCVWKSLSCLKSVHALSTQYPACRTFFRDILELGNSTVHHVVDELLDYTVTRPLDQLKALLLALNDYLGRGTSRDTIQKLAAKKIIPVKASDGNNHLMSYAVDTFYLADRPSLYECFLGKVDFIDFTVDQVRELSPLIEAMELEDYLLSNAVEEENRQVGAEIFDQNQTEELRVRARYLLRLVPEEVQKSKNRIMQLSGQLANLKVWGVASIKVTRTVDGIMGVDDTGNVVYNDTDETKLDIYIPFDPEKHESTKIELSEDLIRICGITSLAHQQLVLPILITPLDSIEKYLEKFNLDRPYSHSFDIDDTVSSVLNRADEPSSAVEPNSEAANSIPGIGGLGPKILSLTLRESIPALDESIISVRQVASSGAILPTRIPTLSLSITSGRQSSPLSGYEEADMRDSKIGSGTPIPGAKHTQDPARPKEVSDGAGTNATFAFEDLRSALREVDTPSRPASSWPKPSPSHSRTVNNARNEPSEENSVRGLHNQYIGILGEVFVNEWLSQHFKDYWDPAQHWTSRNRVQVYENLPFREMERDYADFTYPDTQGKLTTLLKELDFLTDAETWLRHPPTYHLEVKSTTEECGEPFFMSNNQVEKARIATIPSGGSIVPKDVYVIIRVYHLRKEGTQPNFTIYVDPWRMYLKRDLIFQARDNYVVTPSAG